MPAKFIVGDKDIWFHVCRLLMLRLAIKIFIVPRILNPVLLMLAVRLNLKTLAGLGCWLDAQFLLGATVPARKSGLELSNADAVGSDQLFGWTGAAERLPARPAQPADFQQAERGTTYSL